MILPFQLWVKFDYYLINLNKKQVYRQFHFCLIMNKSIIIGIIIAVVIAIGFGVLMSSDNTIQSLVDENIAETGEEAPTPKSYSVQLEESVGVVTP